MKSYKAFSKAIALGIFFVCAVWLGNQIKGSAFVQQLVQQFSYAGVFLLAFVSGFNVVVPIPAISFLPIFSQAGLGTAQVLIVVSIGMTCGDALGFLLGKYGRKMVPEASLPKAVQKMESFFKRHTYGPSIFFFIYASFMPLPNELVVIPAAATGLAWWRVLVPILLGNVVLNTLIVLGISRVFL